MHSRFGFRIVLEKQLPSYLGSIYALQYNLSHSLKFHSDVHYHNMDDSVSLTPPPAFHAAQDVRTTSVSLADRDLLHPGSYI